MDASATVREYPCADWLDPGAPDDLTARLEDGAVLFFPQLPFALDAAEVPLLDPHLLAPKTKNVTIHWPAGRLKGSLGTEREQAALQALLNRYADAAEALARRLLPSYAAALQRDNTSLRLASLAERPTGRRHDDRRLHIDAFRGVPLGSARVLRVFSNIDPRGEARQWRLGEPFEALARRYLPRLRRPMPGVAWLLQRMGKTRARRTAYDHAMLQLHDLTFADAAFQADSPQMRFDFPPGATWIMFGDQVVHAAMAGQFALEQSFHLDVCHMQRPETSPQRTLERLLGRALL